MTMQDLIGWKEGKNDKKMGLFGDVDAFMGAIEEQSGGTLHCHFLLWIKNHHHVCQGIAKNTKREKWEKILCQHADRMMSCKMSALLDPDQKQLVCEKCGGKMKKCLHQDLCELRTKKGETSFQEKNIV